MRIQTNPDSVVVTDDKVVPVMWKDVVLTMAADAWERLLGSLDNEDRATFEQPVKKREFRPDKRSIAMELKKGGQVPGTDLKFGQLRLVID